MVVYVLHYVVKKNYQLITKENGNIYTKVG